MSGKDDEIGFISYETVHFPPLSERQKEALRQLVMPPTAPALCALCQQPQCEHLGTQLVKTTRTVGKSTKLR